jgi:hypothetical protein
VIPDCLNRREAESAEGKSAKLRRVAVIWAAGLEGRLSGIKRDAGATKDHSLSANKRQTPQISGIHSA